MKTKVLAVVTAVMMVAALGAVYRASGTVVHAAGTEKGSIVVSGAGNITVKPDVAYVTLGVTTQDASPKVAQEKNNVLIASVIETMKGLGIAENDIKTTNYYMYPSYDYSGSVNKLIGYNVNNSVTVTVRDIGKVGDVLAVAVDAGANVSSGVQFGILDSSDAYAEAMKMAIKNASDKAKVIAAALGTTIGSPVLVTEGGGYSAVYGAETRPMANDSASVPVQAGELTISASVQVTYEYDR